ncbi:hypothetical protein H2248_005486 [Termitomyces sp. 'cryptogamus']|nr:hypothetical protein H2248_005486 [Termitomyces sp. 'cryptogamus']
MQRFVRSPSGEGSAASNVVNIPEEPAFLTITEGRGSNLVGTTGNTIEPSSASDKDRPLFSGVLDKFHYKNFSFGLTRTSTPTSDQRLSGSDYTEANYTRTQISDPVELTDLASKIQSLLKALPLPSLGTFKFPKDLNQSQRDDDGRPIPPHGVTQIHDAKLIAMLQNATVMNGGQHGDDVRERRMSVWSVLESLDGEDGTDVGRSEEDGLSREDNFREASGIMMYSPLTPTNLSLVEIAESGVFNPEDQEEQAVDPTSEIAQAAGWMGMWPFSVWSNSAATGSGAHSTASPAPSIAPSLHSSPSGRSARLNTHGKKRVWIPSKNKLSFQAVWWGYRIYLPPPVMDALSDKSMEYAKRTATITTALTWFFYNIPLTALPTAVRPAVLLLQTLIPYIGYIGTFISWSWGTIQSYDTDHGVILTATWLLPIALIPSTWEADDFPPPSPPSPPNHYLPPPSPSPTPQQSPTVPLPTPPVTPPSATTPRPEIPAQFPMEQLLSPAQSFTTALASPPQSPAPIPSPSSYLPFAPPASSPIYFPNDNMNTDIRMLSPIHLGSSYPSPTLPHASEPLPLWVTPPPPPSPPTIPLPEIEEEVGTPKFAMKLLGKSRGKEGRKKDEGKDGQGKKRFKAIAGAFGGRKGEGSKAVC